MKAKRAHSSDDSTNRVELMLAGVRAAGLKLTPQRIAIVRELATDESHPTAQELFDRLRPSLPTMSFATVYNTLDALSAAGLCAALSFSPGPGRFDPNMLPHNHAVCDACGSVRDVRSAGAASPSSDAASVRALALASPGFELRSVDRTFRGFCAECASGSKEPRPKTH